MIRKVFYIALFSILGLRLSAQDFKRRFHNAKDLFAEGKYELSMEAFRPLMVYSAGNVYAEYANFYYGLCAYKQNFKSLAKSTLLNIKIVYPQWPHLDEVNFWLSLIYFEQGEYFHAMELLNLVKSSLGKTEIKQKFISSIEDAEILRMMLENFQGDQVVAKILIERLLREKKYDHIVEAKNLIVSYGFKEDEFDVPSLEPVFKDKYRVSLVFPFLAKDIEPTPGTKRNQYILDLYQGIRLGVDSLSKAGIRLELAAYDTERNPAFLNGVLSNDELKSTDVIIGPLFSDELEPVKKFSIENNIPMIHPVSSSSDFSDDNPNAMLFQPSYSTIGRKTAEYLKMLNINKPCIVFYGDTPKDTVMANAFKSRAEELNITIALFYQVPKEQSSVVNSILATPIKFDKYKNPVEFKLKKDSIGCIFVASDSELIYTKVISSVDSRGDSTLILGQENWLEKPGMDFLKFEQLQITLSSPNFINLWSPNYLEFQKKYIKIHRSIPSYYARVGYEFTLFLGGKFRRHGTSFFSGISKDGRSDGWILPGFDFFNSKDNQLVPFIRFRNGKLVRVY